MKSSFAQKSVFLFFIWMIFAVFPVSCFSNPHPKVWNLPNENLVFVGREEYLAGIHSFFKRDDRRILALTGEGGFGKSQIAKKYAQEFAEEYDLIWWVDAQQDLPSQFEKLAIALNVLLPEKEHIIPSKMSKDALIDVIKNILRIKPLKYLIIFDNTREYSQIEKLIPYAHLKFRKNVLLTSRNSNIWIDTIKIAKFKRSESIQFIEETLPQDKLIGMEKLAETLGDYPLGLTTALAFIKTHQTTDISKYIGMYLKSTLNTRGKKVSPLLDNYPKNAYATLLISLRDIENDSKDALESLLFMSLLNSNDIPETYIEAWLKKTKSTLTIDEAIKSICDQSLIKINKKEEKNPMYYLSIHDINHQLINENISMEDKRKLLVTAIEVMLDVFSGTSEIFIKKIVQEPIHLLHAQTLCENAKIIGYSSSNLLKLKVCIFECLMGGLRDFDTAKIFLEDIEKDLKDSWQLELYYEALFKINKGFFEVIYNVNYDGAIHSMKEGLSILNLLENYHEERLRAITNLAQYYGLLGQISMSEHFIDLGKNIFMQSQSIVYNGLFLYAWSIILNDQGKFKNSIDILNKAKKYSTLPADYPAIYHPILYQKAEALIKQKELAKAWEVLKECEKQTKIFYQERKNTTIANVLVFKSLVLLYKKSSIAQAVQNLNEALKIYEDLFHGQKKHRNQARAHLALGKAFVIKKDFDNALKEYLLSEEIYNIVLKEKQIDDVSDLYAELAILGMTLKDEGMTQKYLNAHIEIFGLDHPRTEQILKHLDRANFSI